MRIALIGAQAWGIVEGTEREPPRGHNATSPNKGWVSYHKRRGLAYYLIWQSLSTTARNLIDDEDNDDPHTMWETLQQRLDARNNVVALGRIRDEYDMQTWRSDDTISSWYGRLLSYQRRLAGTTWRIPNENIAMKLLMRLPEKWHTVREQIMAAQGEDLDLGTIISALETNAEVVAAAASNTSASGTGNTDVLISLQGLKENLFRHNGNGSSRGRGRGRGRGSYRGNNNHCGRQNNRERESHGVDKTVNVHAGLQCNYCKKIGHIQRNCWHAKPRQNDGEQDGQERTATLAVTDTLLPQYTTALIAATAAPRDMAPAWRSTPAQGSTSLSRPRTLNQGRTNASEPLPKLR